MPTLNRRALLATAAAAPLAAPRMLHAQTKPEKLVYIGENQGGWKRALMEEVAPAFEKVWANREVIQLGDQRLKIVSKEGLITMKQLSGRPQDLADIDALRKIENT